MTTAVVSRSGLRSLSWDELAGMLRDGDEAAIPAVLAEGRRRDKLEKAQAARDAEKRTWEEGAHAQYLAAVALCNGYLVNKAGERAGVREWSLWSGPADTAWKYATRELREFWLVNPRIPIGQYRQQASSGRAAQREDLNTPAPVIVPAPAVWRETTVTIGSWPRAAYWVIRAGRAALYFDRDAAVAELLKG